MQFIVASSFLNLKSLLFKDPENKIPYFTQLGVDNAGQDAYRIARQAEEVNEIKM
jgi:hypothetical protein